jgi:hypothetical protein
MKGAGIAILQSPHPASNELPKGGKNMKKHAVVVNLDDQAYSLLQYLHSRARLRGSVSARSGPATILQEATLHLLGIVNAPDNLLIKEMTG